MTDRRTMTLADLLHLVDRARRGTILPAELDDLHAGITAMATDRDSWETTAYRHASLWRTEQDEVKRHVTANLEAAERAQREIDRLRAVVQRVMDLDAPDVAAALNPAYALGWKDALALARGVLDPAQRPSASTGSGAAVADP